MKHYIQTFIQNLENQGIYTENTLLAYSTDLKRFMQYLQLTLREDPKIDDLNSQQIASFLKDEQQKGLRKNTLLRRRATLRQFLAYLHSQGQISGAVSSEVIFLEDAFFSPGKSVAASPEYLTDEQIENLECVLQNAKHPRSIRDLAILHLLLETGLSVQMLVAINLDDVDLEIGRMRAPDLPNGIWLPLYKSVQSLKEYIKSGRPDLNVQAGENALFISQMGSRMSRQGVWQIFKHWGEIAGLQATLSPRVMRHTAVINLERAGRPLDEIQLLLGHRNPISTQALLRRLRNTYN